MWAIPRPSLLLIFIVPDSSHAGSNSMCTSVIYNTGLLGEEYVSLVVKGVVVQVEACLNKSEVGM